MSEEVSLKRGRPLLIAVRVPITVELSRVVGLDVERWLEKGLLDILIAGDGSRPMAAPFRGMIELGHKYDVSVYPCISWGFWEYWAFLESGFETIEAWHKEVRGGVESWRKSIEASRGAAMNIWNLGADGVYIFNFFNPNHQMWWELGDLETLAKLDKIYGVDYRDLAQALQLKEGGTVNVNLLVGEDVQSKELSELRLRLHLTRLTSKDDVTVRLNESVLNSLKPAATVQTTPKSNWLECLLSPTQIKRGDNKVELILNKRDKSVQAPILLDGLQLLVHLKR
ncbi:MAG: hypothetical protein FJ045_04635 [Crenarchaeota archaeon]|nr:hypothetical protein [Thermoproteota archaeon]